MKNLFNVFKAFQSLNEKDKKPAFEWYKLPKPLVTECCGSFAWAHAMYESPRKGGCDLCYQCMQPTKIRPVTYQEWKKVSIISDLTEEQFEALWDSAR